MYRNLRPAALNMSLVPGLHLSTSKSQCPRTPGEGVKPCLLLELEECESPDNLYESIRSCGTSADGESLRSFGAPDGPMCKLLGACQDAASDSAVVGPCEPNVTGHCEPPSPVSSALVRSGVGAPALKAVLPLGAGAVDHSEPPSPFDSILVCALPQPATQLERRRGWAEEPQVVETYEFDAVGCREPDSPFDSMLLRSKRQNAFARSVLPFVVRDARARCQLGTAM